MENNRHISKLWLYIGFFVSFVIAFESFNGPLRRMPIDYYWAIHWSQALSSIWLIVTAFLIFRSGKRALWTLLGLPLAAYWPLWLLTHQLPPCYVTHNCI
jgi:hypothetical protein